jgi:DNA mismatch repair protein MutH
MAAPARPTLAVIAERLAPLVGVTHSVPRTANKGGAGHHLETLLGIPHSPACLDCEDGELKAFPLKRNAAGRLVPKETVAVTMCDRAALATTPFPASRAATKLRNTLFVPYFRPNDESVVYYAPMLFTEAHALWSALAADYATIQTRAAAGEMTGSIGTYLQTRTKGPGKGSTSRAFYLRPQFLSAVFPGGF